MKKSIIKYSPFIMLLVCIVCTLFAWRVLLDINTKKQQEIFDQLEAEIKSPIDKFKSTLSNDIKDIATSSVDGIMNAISLIPGVGTTLQLWRLLNNVVVIMSKTTNSVSQAKTEGGKIKGSINAISQNIKGGAENAPAAGGGGSSTTQVKTPAADVMGVRRST